jgi:hypothetical protein
MTYSRKKEATPLGEAFQDLLKSYRLEDTYQEKVLLASWSKLMGKTIADRTSNLYIKDKNHVNYIALNLIWMVVSRQLEMYSLRSFTVQTT